MVMFEKRWTSVPPQLFTSNGNIDGHFTILDASLFKVKQQVTLKSNLHPAVRLEVKRIIGDIVYVGAIGENILNRTDVSAFLVADSATISADEQPRSSIPQQEIERLTYEEEPTVARRVVLVDSLGNKITATNPLPTNVEVTVGNVNVNLDAFSSPPDNAMSVGTENGIKTGTPHVINVDSELKLRVKDVDAISKLSDINNKLNTLGQKHSAGSIPVVLADDQSAILIDLDAFSITPDNVMIVGSQDGSKTGTKTGLVYNIRQQILATHDRTQQITYSDFGTKDQRITAINYTSATFPGVTARKAITYTLVGSKYRRDAITWTII